MGLWGRASSKPDALRSVCPEYGLETPEVNRPRFRSPGSAGRHREMSQLRDVTAQFGANIRMRHADQQLGALAQRLAMQVDGAVFRHDPVDVPAGGHHAGTGSKLEHDA